MLTPSELLWTEIGASFCWTIVSGLLALMWTNRARIGTGSYSPLPAVVFAGVFAPIGVLLTAHAVAGRMLTTAGGVPLWTFLLPLGCFAVAIVTLRGYFSIRAQVAAEGPDVSNSPASAMPVMLMVSAMFAGAGALVFWMLTVIH